MITPSRVFAAINIHGGSDKSLDSIPSNLIKNGDFAIVQDESNIYFYVCDADSNLPENIPYIVEPDDLNAGGITSYKRWHLVSTKYFVDDIIQTNGSYIKTSKIKAIENEGLKFISSDGITITLTPDGKLNTYKIIANDQVTVNTDGRRPPFIIDSSLLVENLNADKLDGYHADRFILKDGSIPFTGTVQGVDPVNDQDLTTKQWTEEYILQIENTIYSYVDDAIAAIDVNVDLSGIENTINSHLSTSSDDHLQYIHIDGRRNFINPIGGVTPTTSNHFTTKNYVDVAISSIITSHSNLTNLDNDDHEHYSHIDARRGFINPVEGKTPITDFHLATKEYVDERIAGIFNTKKLQIHTFDHNTTEWVINHNFGNKYIVVDFYDKFDNKQIKPDSLILVNDDTAIATFINGTKGYAVVTGLTEHYNHTNSQTWIVEHSFSSKEVIFNIFNNNNEEIFPDTTTIIDNTHIAFTFSSPEQGYAVLSNDIIVYHFSTPALEWHIFHTFNNKNLLANCFTDSNIEIIPDNIEATDDNTLLLTFHDPKSGYVVVSGSEAIILDPGMFIINHNHLRNLDNDDHIQYSLVDGTRGYTGTIAGIYPVADEHLTTKQYVDDEILSAIGNVIVDHSGLSGLDNDDHTQYILVDGTRGFTDVIEGVHPTQAFHLTTKQYVDSVVNASSSVAQRGVIPLVQNADNITVHLTTSLSSDYSIELTIENTIDINPSIYSFMIVRKTTTEFDVIFSGYIDSNNYNLNYTVHPIN